jgi:DNA-binding CsgD family transcriptional regulator/PAS domain-containing protein
VDKSDFMSIDDRILAAIETLYDAAMDNTRWPEALRSLAEVTNSQAATFWVLDASGEPRLPVFTAMNFAPEFIDEYLDQMTPMDPTVQYLVGHPYQRIVHDGQYLSEGEIDHNAYYSWHLQHTDMRYRLLGQVRLTESIQAGVALHRIGRIDRYDAGDVERFAVLYRHLERALAIGFHVGSLGALHQCLTEILDRSDTAILLLDGQKHLIHANRRAEQLAAQADGIQLTGKGLALSRTADNQRLQHLIAQAMGKDAGGVPFGGIMPAPRHSGKRPYLLHVAPVSQNLSELSAQRPTVCISVIDPEERSLPPVSTLQSALGLTAAEANLAHLLVGGTDLRSSAAKLRIGYGTARTRLAEIFEKTQTHRQAELISLILAIQSLL